MVESFIYSSLDPDKVDLSAVGWFEPKVPFRPLDTNVNFVKYFGTGQTPTQSTLVAYFPGCFAEFHEGHLDVVNQVVELCRAITSDYLVVVSPANSDYTTEKYGHDSLFATNKYRYDKICHVLSSVKGNVAVDLNPMLNFEIDHNFTDLLFDFIVRQGLDYDGLEHTPRIVAGKDREYFTGLARVTDKIKTFYIDDTTGASSSAYIARAPVTRVTKKNLLLRCDNKEQYELFQKFFHDKYKEITCQLISDEIVLAKDLHAKHNFDVTICKDYAEFLPYISTHRVFSNPLSSGDGHVTNGNFSGLKVLDSDVFSGSTKKFIDNQGAELHAVHDFSDCLDTWELLDIAGFYTSKWQYPYVDISSRCSIGAFNLSDHKNFLVFKTELQKIKKQ